MDIDAIVAKVTESVYSRLGAAQNAAAPDKTFSDLGSVIEHSLLNPDTSAETIRQGCIDAKKYCFANVCVSPYYVSMAAELLRGSGVCVCTPVGFPHGAASTAAKCAEIREVIMNGAAELDISMMIVAIKSGDYDAVKKDLREMIHVAGGRAKVKAIYEQGILTEDEKKRSLTIAKECGVDFIKISNALTGKKACKDDVEFVRSVIGSGIGIKIDGGIKDAETVRILLGAGANRVGCSASVQIVQS
jgi:deoxyribose-phosphate aldolase